MKQPILSICIPTNGRENILKTTLESIYSQNVNEELFEVCVADNAETDETLAMIKKYFPNERNLIYKKNSSIGYLNTIEALRLGNGKFLKLSNNYSGFKSDKLYKLINDIKNCSDKSQLFFLDNSSSNRIEKIENFDKFIKKMHYYTSWSTAFGIWKSDFDESENERLKYDLMFPHVSLLLENNIKDDYLIFKDKYCFNQKINRKGGYNLPEVFGYRYLNIMKNLSEHGQIKKSTYRIVKNRLLFFISLWNSLTIYDNKISTYDFTNYKEILKRNYSKFDMFRYEHFKYLYLLRMIFIGSLKSLRFRGRHE